jgi:transcriptional regulator with XRE-family HTH domain
MNLEQKVKQLGVYIRKTRINKGIKTQKEFSALTGIRANYLSNIETGYINPERGPVVPSDEVLGSIAKALEIPVGHLHAQLGRTEGAQPEQTEETLQPPDGFEVPQIWIDQPEELQLLLRQLQDEPREIQREVLRLSTHWIPIVKEQIERMRDQNK